MGRRPCVRSGSKLIIMAGIISGIAAVATGVPVHGYVVQDTFSDVPRPVIEKKFSPVTNRRKLPILRGGTVSVKRICRYSTIRSPPTTGLHGWKVSRFRSFYVERPSHDNCKARSMLFLDNAHICQEKSIDEHFIFPNGQKSSRAHAQVILAVRTGKFVNSM